MNGLDSNECKKITISFSNLNEIKFAVSEFDEEELKKIISQFNNGNLIKFQHAWVLSSLKIDKKFRTEHTRKELEEAGFGWVFNCPGIEIEEVEE